jgi:hypothetical protein
MAISKGRERFPLGMRRANRNLLKNETKQMPCQEFRGVLKFFC